MARFITLKRKYFVYGALVILIAFIGVFGLNILWGSEEIISPLQVEPELKILSIEFNPQIAIRDLTYGEEKFKGMQTINKDTFTISAVVQNMTEKTVTDIPIVLTLKGLEDKSKSLSKEGKIPTLEPGATAKVTFENVKAQGDAEGKSSTAGQHEMILAIKANPAGGIEQNTEARIVFNVDTTVK